MKSLIVFSVFSFCYLIGQDLNAQNLANGNFENISPGCFICNTVTSNCVIGWKASHGSPNESGGSTGNGISMWAQSGKSEGLYQNVTLPKCSEIQIRLKAKTTTGNVRLRIAFANNLPTAPDGFCDGSQTPGADQQIIYDQTITNSNWSQINTGVVEPNKNYSQLWIYTVSTGSTYRLVSIDEVELTQCLPQIFYQNNTSLQYETIASGTISAGKNVTSGTQGDVKVLSGQEAIFTAGVYVKLSPGFQAVQGSEFTANIDWCRDACYVQLSPTSRVKEQATKSISPRNYHPPAMDSTSVSQGPTVYPIPSSDYVYVELEQHPDFNCTVQIQNHEGEVLITDKTAIRNNRMRVSLKNLRKGMYILKVTCGDEVYQKRIVKE